MDQSPNHERMVSRARKVAEALRGTCRSLHDFASDEEINDRDFCAELDILIACCDVCDWWVTEDETENCGDECPQHEGMNHGLRSD